MITRTRIVVRYELRVKSCISKAGLELTKGDLELPTILFPLPERQDYSPAPPHCTYAVLGTDPRALCMLGRAQPIRLHP